MKKVIVGKSKGLADSKQCDIHIVGKRYSFKERTPKIGDYISIVIAKKNKSKYYP